MAGRSHSEVLRFPTRIQDEWNNRITCASRPCKHLHKSCTRLSLLGCHGPIRSSEIRVGVVSGFISPCFIPLLRLDRLISHVNRLRITVETPTRFTFNSMTRGLALYTTINSHACAHCFLLCLSVRLYLWSGGGWTDPLTTLRSSAGSSCKRSTCPDRPPWLALEAVVARSFRRDYEQIVIVVSVR